ncbi:hypothetical protein TUMSATVNIG1_11070 [Vibrio nigripulchritudo]|nr:hypothetical protein VNTUMSATTG_11020 [Vibrio nigripulchritudo]BDU30498.1 hypothetical protein TUMSATVNIG1_11070 [Vibrio nigripulchritudo]BDU36650.1 hypothetical protein TUMSATVNIG2_11190 [Vibrio nigripulchritudo]BDU42359.1 hypothetical protein TUMSATVNIG3_11570 [Vibrio nigripulchritudo]
MSKMRAERSYCRSIGSYRLSMLGLYSNRYNTAIVYVVVKLWSATVGLGEVFTSLSLVQLKV